MPIVSIEDNYYYKGYLIQRFHELWFLVNDDLIVAWDYDAASLEKIVDSGILDENE